MYVSTEENIIKKISVLPRTMKTCVVEIWKPLSNPSHKILSMHFLKHNVSYKKPYSLSSSSRIVF